MSDLARQKWHPRHWLMPLGGLMGGTSIMLIFILKVFIPHKGHFAPPSVEQFNAQLASLDGLAFLGIWLSWYGFWLLFIVAAC